MRFMAEPSRGPAGTASHPKVELTPPRLSERRCWPSRELPVRTRPRHDRGLTNPCGNHRPASGEPPSELESLGDHGADGSPQFRCRRTKRVRHDGENDQRRGKRRLGTRGAGDAVDGCLEPGGRDNRVAREIWARPGFAHLVAWRSESTADTTDD